MDRAPPLRKTSSCALHASCWNAEQREVDHPNPRVVFHKMSASGDMYVHQHLPGMLPCEAAEILEREHMARLERHDAPGHLSRASTEVTGQY